MAIVPVLTLLLEERKEVLALRVDRAAAKYYLTLT